MILSDNYFGVTSISENIPKTVTTLIEQKMQEFTERSKKEFTRWLADHNLFIVNGEIEEKEQVDTNLKRYLVDGFYAILPINPGDAQPFWTDGEHILSKDKEAINYLADFFESLGFAAVTGYFDPEEDRENNEVDRYTGFHYMVI